MLTWRRAILFLAILAVTFIALGTRIRAVDLLPIDFDEDDYLGAAQRYAEAMREGDLGAIIDYEYNFEHPPLTKLVYGLAILPLPEEELIPALPSSAAPVSKLPEPHFRFARLTSTVLGTLEVLALAILDPLAGLFLAVHTWQIKYTSQIMLEPLPALTSLLTVLFYVRWRAIKTKKQNSAGKFDNAWLLGSAVALGLTAASKYIYCISGIAILVDWLWSMYPVSQPITPYQTKQAGYKENRLFRFVGWLGPPLIWGLIAVVTFFVFNPRLWSEPIPRLVQSVFFHGGYAQSEHVRRAGFPAWQPLVWLAGPVPWHPGVFILPIDLYISLLAVLGLRRLWDKQRVFALWLGIALGFLLIWPTKWPQYILILTGPLSMAAAQGFRSFIWEPLGSWVRTLRVRRQQQARPGSHFPSERAEAGLARRISLRDSRRAIPWLLPGLLALTLIALFPLIYQGAMSLTDFNALSIRDGIQGGVWRAVWQGLSGQEEPVRFDPFEGTRSKEVHYAGPLMLKMLLLGALPEILVFSVMWTILSVGLQTVLGVFTAFLLHPRGVRFRGWWRAIFILPWAIPEFIGALIWLRFFEPKYGWLAVSQRLPAGVQLSNWLDNPNKTLLVLLIAATWYGFPFIMLVATAGLKLIPKDVYDAAAIDGASGWNQFRFVTWPMLFPLIVPAIIIRSIFAFNQFYLFITIRTDFPALTFATLSYYVFSPNFGGLFAVSAAINMFTVLVLVALILWFNRMSRAAEGVTYA